MNRCLLLCVLLAFSHGLANAAEVPLTTVLEERLQRLEVELASVRAALARQERADERARSKEQAADERAVSKEQAADETAALDRRLKKVETFVEKSKRTVPIRRSSKSAWDLRFGGRIFYDWATSNADGAVEDEVGEEFTSGSFFRRARLVVKGFANPDLDFKFELDFADGDADLTDVYIDFRLPTRYGLRVGRHNEPFSLENLNSSRFILFLERAPVSEALSPKRNSGISIYPERDAPYPGIWFGYFRSANSAGVSSDVNGHNLTFRWTTTPLFDKERHEAFTFGMALSHRETGPGALEFAGKTGVRLMPELGSTGEIDAEQSRLIGFQALYVNGPHALVSEVVRTNMSLRGGGSASVSGGYVAFSRILTGEKQPCDLEKRGLGRLNPERNYAHGTGGAWQVAFRYDWLDLDDDDAGITGGESSAKTVGVNWILNQNARIMINLVDTELEGVGDVRTSQIRFQVDF